MRTTTPATAPALPGPNPANPGGLRGLGSLGSPATALNRTLAVTVIGSVMAVLDMTIVNVAMRRLSQSFGASLQTIQWTATAYTLALAAVIPTAAWAMARLGAKRTYLTALILFTLGSLLAACAWDAGSLIAFRAVQGLGGGLLQPVGMTMVMGAADRSRLGRAMAVGGLPILVGPVAGPVLGGWLVDAASWHWIFLVNVPVGALALALGLRLLPPDAQTPRTGPAPGTGPVSATDPAPGTGPASGIGLTSGTGTTSATDLLSATGLTSGIGPASGNGLTSGTGPAPGTGLTSATGPTTAADPAPGTDPTTATGRTAARLDLPGLLMLSPGLALLLYGLARGGERGDLLAPGALVPALAGAALAAGFVRRALTASAPLLDLRLLRDRTFAAGIGTLALFTCGYFGAMLLGPLYWQQERGLSATAAGLLGVPTGLVVGTTMQFAARRIDKVAPRRLIPAGIAVAAFGMALLAWQTGVPGVAPWRIVASAMVLGLGVGVVLLPTMTTASRELPGDRLAAASTALSINSQLGASVGTAVLSVVLGQAGMSPAGFRTTYAVAATLLALAALPAMRLPGRRQPA
ncbi:MFS transporter [Streptomyces sp. NPDC002589]|uniref:MFS transporter n=1 Tax=Streptomyces sp. NPDC002589 TaxID=3154420 RepID=UPI0033180BE7